MDSNSMSAAITCIVDAAEKAYFNVRNQTANMVIDRMIKFMEENIEVDEELRKYFDEFRSEVTNEIKEEAILSKKQKKKANKVTKKVSLKALTANNLFIQDKMAELKAAGVKGDAEKGNILKQANVFWRDMTPEDREAWTNANNERLVALNKDRAENPEKYMTRKKLQRANVSEGSTSK